MKLTITFNSPCQIYCCRHKEIKMVHKSFFPKKSIFNSVLIIFSHKALLICFDEKMFYRDKILSIEWTATKSWSEYTTDESKSEKWNMVFNLCVSKFTIKGNGPFSEKGRNILRHWELIKHWMAWPVWCWKTIHQILLTSYGFLPAFE